MENVKSVKSTCFHCGEPCTDAIIQFDGKPFCCSGCQTVYGILHQHHLDDYYCYTTNPGVKIEELPSETKYDYLLDHEVEKKLIEYKDEKQGRVSFHLPQMHCSSCLWLLEHLYKIHDGILNSQVNFPDKQLTISYLHQRINLKEIATLLAKIGYEPRITLQDYEESKSKHSSREIYIKLGLAGFCFANIMLISFPEYLGLEMTENKTLVQFFRYTNVALSIPLLLISGKEFFVNAIKGIRLRMLNIDAPIALAVAVTFLRSLYEIITQTGAGYLDSMSGIIFFMLIGRSLQNKTFSALKFNRDYKSYFPISVSKLVNGKEQSTKIQDIRIDDLLRLRHKEIIPVDCLLSSKRAEIDYSFITGESDVKLLNAGDVLYAGGKVVSASVDVVVAKEFSQNSFTSLWNHSTFNKNDAEETTFVDTIAKYFSVFLLILASASFALWYVINPSNAWLAFTSVLIVACPCTLLLASSYTYGFILELFSLEGFFAKNAQTIQKMAKVNHIVFDKTGTLTQAHHQNIELTGNCLGNDELNIIISVLAHSTHPLSRVIVNRYQKGILFDIKNIKEVEGQGIEAWYEDSWIKIGRASYVGVDEINAGNQSTVYFKLGHGAFGCFLISNVLKSGVNEMIQKLADYKLSLLSGDNEMSRRQMQEVFPLSAKLNFKQTPNDKLHYIEQQQASKDIVLMIGDGINDAGALKQSDVGISLVEDTFAFSPASDVIMNQKRIQDLDKFLLASRRVKKLIIATFIYSLLYNAVGLSYAVTAGLNPLIAAILMPASSISVILIAYLGTQHIHKSIFKNNKRG